ncbi:MAG: YcxB family protein [Clostridia bacterium]|nr:YcxB family protein [Clostridia bacterium]
MNEQIPEQEWAVDLRREEYVYSQLLMARVAGPLRTRTFALVASLLLAAILLGTVVVDHQNGYPPDWITIVMGVVLTASALFLWWFMPWQVKRNAEKQYDRALACGQNFYGTLRVYGDKVEKAGDTVTATIPMDATSFFVEDSRVMVITGRSRWAVVLPARCMTDEMAAAVRQAADRLPLQRRRFIARLQAQGEPVVPVRMEPVPVLWQADVHYTPEEYTDLSRAMLRQRYWRVAPVLGVLSVLAGFVFGWDGRSILPCLLWTLACFALLTLFNYTLPLSRIKRQVPLMQSRDFTVEVRIDSRAVQFGAPHGVRIGVPWSEIRHVYDKGSFVEICDDKQFFRIPKRCIEDVEAFDALITRCRNEQNV